MQEIVRSFTENCLINLNRALINRVLEVVVAYKLGSWVIRQQQTFSFKSPRERCATYNIGDSQHLICYCSTQLEYIALDRI